MHEIITKNKAGNIVDQEKGIEMISSLKDSSNNMTAFCNPIVTISQIPIQVLYNEKTDSIRVFEYEKQTPPLPIRFDVSECYAGVEAVKLVKIESESAPETFFIELDLGRGKGPRIFETQTEKIIRQRRFKKEAPLVLSDFINGGKGTSGVADFCEALHQRVRQ